MENLVELYWQAGLNGSVIILLILLSRLCLRKAPRQLMCILWILAAVRLLLPLQLESVLSLQPAVLQSAVTVKDIPAWLPMLWAAVAGALVVYMAASYLYLRYKVRFSIKCGDGTLECEKLSSAFVLGYLRPRIYLPTDVPEKDWAHIVAHEQAHIARGDHWWKLLGFLCVCLHWYNPLVWLAYTLFCRDTEVACDERVVCDLTLQERKAYSAALLNCGKRVSGLPAVALCFGKESLRKRIKNVLSYRKPDLWITAVAGMLAVFVAICFLTVPRI